ncbi:hypothetical protein [Pseudomonas sp. 22 E 5]|nr:hypothetical protein [Pseudomonas sp. 22 E 5]
MPTFAGHQPYPFNPKNAGNRFELRAQCLELHVHKVGAKQVNGVAMFTAHLAFGDVDAVLHQQVENVPQDADTVLAVHFNTHEKAQMVGKRRGFLPLSADSRQDYVTACDLFTAQDTDRSAYRNENFTNNGDFSYAQAPDPDGIRHLPRYQ